MTKSGESRQGHPPTSSSIEPLEKRRLFAAQLGINVNNFGGDDYGAIVTMLRDSGTKDVRLWYGFDSYQQRTLANIAKYVKKFAHDGFSVTLSVNPRKGRHGTYDETREMFDWLVKQPGMADSVDYWEVGNEPDSEHYWKGTLPEFVSDYLIPASKALRAAGEKVVSGGVAWNPEDIKTLVDAGMLKYVDYVGYHPYRPSTANLKKSIAAVKSYVGGKPLMATEWNIRGRENNKQSWAEGVEDFWTIIRENFAIAHYFAAKVQDTPAGPAGVLTASNKPNRPFYNVYMGLQDIGKPVDNGGGNDDGGKDDDDKNDDDKGSDGDKDNSTGSGGSKPDDSKTDGDNDNSTGSGGSKPDDSKTDGDDDNSGNSGGVGSGGSSSGGSSGGGSSSGGNSSGGGTSTPKPTKPQPVVPAKPVIPPAISSVSLVNASRDRVISPYAVLSGAATVDLASTGTAFLSFLASANKKTGSVKFTIGGNEIVDNDGRFTLYGEDTTGNINGLDFTAGRLYVLTVQAFSGENATGRASDIQTYVINVINTADPQNTTTPAAALALARQKAAQIAKRNRLTPVPVLPGLE